VIQKCKVAFVDRRGVQHSVEVQAAAVFEAVCRASAIFKHSVVEDPTWAAEFVVAVVEKPNIYRVKTVELKKWLNRNARSPRELMQKTRLREMLGGESTDRWCATCVHRKTYPSFTISDLLHARWHPPAGRSYSSDTAYMLSEP
jgi:hypothetical protein